LQDLVAARYQFCAFAVASLDVRQHGVHLLGINQSTHGGCRVQRVARLPAFEGFDHQWQEFVLDRALDQQARTCGTDFALVEGNGAGSRLGSRLQVRCVGKDDVRALAAGFEPDTLHVGFARVDHQLLGDLGRTGEHQRIDVHVQGQSLADGMAIAWQHVEYTCRDTGFNSQCGDTDGGQWGFFGRLKDYRVTGRQSRAQFPAGHHQREVPRHDGSDNAHRLTGHQAQLIVRGSSNLVVNLVDGFAAPAQRTGCAGHVDAQ